MKKMLSFQQILVRTVATDTSSLLKRSVHWRYRETQKVNLISRAHEKM